MSKRIFICQVIPKEKIENFQVSQAGNNFCYSLIEGGIFDETYSISPININEKISFRKDCPVVFIQKRLFSIKILRWLNFFFDNIYLFYKIILTKNKGANFWFYNLYTSNLILFLLLKLSGFKIFVIVADFEPSKRFFTKDFFIRLAFRIVDGVISLNEGFKECYDKNIKIISGVVKNAKPDAVKRRIDFSKTFLFSGALEDYAGIKIALEVFSQLPDANLLITGRGSLEREVQEYAKRYHNINYLGFLSYEEYLSRLEEVTFCLSLRNPNYPFNNYNFPSKIIEYFNKEKIVISTFKYENFPSENLIICNYNVVDLIDKITRLLLIPIGSLEEMQQKNKLSIQSMYSTHTWFKSIKEIENYGRNCMV